MNRWNGNKKIGVVGMLTVVLGLSAWICARANEMDEQERKVKESEVPKAALDALKKLADGAKFDEFEEETKNGLKFYEAEWKGPAGKREATVTENGDLLELEEPVSESAVPSAVLAAARKAAGNGTPVKFEKKTFVTYEVEFKKDGKEHELYISPAGQVHGQAEEADDDDGDEED